jgi:methionine synthase II (cobalamin-independent)
MGTSSHIARDSLIEDLVNYYTFAAHYLSVRGIRCILCGEPIWGTLEEASREKGFIDTEIDEFVNELKLLALNSDNYFKSLSEKACLDTLPEKPDIFDEEEPQYD